MRHSIFVSAFLALYGFKLSLRELALLHRSGAVFSQILAGLHSVRARRKSAGDSNHEWYVASGAHIDIVVESIGHLDESGAQGSMTEDEVSDCEDREQVWCRETREVGRPRRAADVRKRMKAFSFGLLGIQLTGYSGEEVQVTSQVTFVRSEMGNRRRCQRSILAEFAKEKKERRGVVKEGIASFLERDEVIDALHAP